MHVAEVSGDMHVMSSDRAAHAGAVAAGCGSSRGIAVFLDLLESAM
jgi:hypothetical protein